MGTWTVIVLSLCLALATLILLRPRGRLPPGPPVYYVIAHLLWFSSTLAGFQSFLGNLWSTYGRVVTIKIGSFSVVMVADRNLAHKMLVQHGAAFADRPPLPFALRLIGSNTCTVGSAGYGHLWRAFRRNLVVEMLNASRIQQCADSRRWVLQIVIDKLQKAAETSGVGVVLFREIFQHAMFCQLVFLMFGEKLDEAAVRKIEASQMELLHFVAGLNLFASTHKISTYLCRESYNRVLRLREQQREIFLPLINSRRNKKESGVLVENSIGFCYLDSLLDLEIPEENGRKLTNEEIISLCSEFLNAGADTTSTALEWIMANIVKKPSVQEKLAEEIGKKTTEDNLQNKPYLKAVILEGLRRHPPVNMLLPHAVTKDICVDGYTVPKGATVNFGVTRINLDEETWPNPLEFRPERFLPGGEGEGVDIAGRKKIQMMSFGVGRRMCPGMGLALLLLEYFVANLVKEFRWEEADGGVDLSENHEFTVVMKNPLRARISFRRTTPGVAPASGGCGDRRQILV